MPIYANGVLIPENSANALYSDGINITDVWADGVQVWNQSLFASQWSGTSSTGGSYPQKLETSGASARWYGGSTAIGAWVAVNSSGTWPAAASVTAYQGFYFGGYGGSPSNGFRFWSTNGDNNTNVYFTIGSGWSGGPSWGNNGFGTPTMYIETSGGLIRLRNASVGTGAWISLN